MPPDKVFVPDKLSIAGTLLLRPFKLMVCHNESPPLDPSSCKVELPEPLLRR